MVANLGKRLTVRLDGKGDFPSIRQAIPRAAQANTVIEIQDNGPYYEKVVVPVSTANLTLHGKKGCWPVIASGGSLGAINEFIEVQAPGTELARLAIVHARPVDTNSFSLRICSGCRVRSVIIWGGYTFRIGPNCELTNIIVAHRPEDSGYFGDGPTVLKNLVWLPRDAVVYMKGCQVENALIPALRCPGRTNLRFCTIPGQLQIEGEPCVVLDSLVGSLACGNPESRIADSNVCSVFGSAVLGRNCSQQAPEFVDAANGDYRLKPRSPGRGKASDGGDRGFRYSPEIVEMWNVALALRARGVIKF